MSNNLNLKTVSGLIGAILGLASGNLLASDLEKSEQLEQQIISDARKSQKKVDTSSDNAFELQAEIDALQKEIKNLKVYQQHLEGLIVSQNQEQQSLDSQLIEIAQTRQSIVPLMYQMLEGLSGHISADMPIHKDSRLARLDKLNALMTQADISDAEKYRRILEAYQIELDYMTKLEAYMGNIRVDGKERQAELLYLGHVSFIARSLDKQNYWVWKNAANSWVSLDKEMYQHLNDAYLVANKRKSPEILLLPLSLQEAGL